MRNVRPTNFVDLYVYSQGITEVPKIWYTWVAIAAIGACVQDRIVYRHYQDTPLIPNLYVVLVGDSGSGKGRAIEPMVKIVEEVCPEANVLRGRYTIQYLADVMAQKKTSPVTSMKNGAKQNDAPVQMQKLWLVMPELANAIGSGGRADDAVKGLTELYDCPVYYVDGTRLFGGSCIASPVINWLAGTTPEWYMSTIRTENILSGFQPRVNVVFAEKDYTRRIPFPTYPEDYSEAVLALKSHVMKLRTASGEFRTDDSFRDAWERWYISRPAPLERLHQALYNAEVKKALKLAMVAALAEKEMPLVLSERHLLRAVSWLNEIKADAPRVIQLSVSPRDLQRIDGLKTYIRERGIVTHSEALRYCSRRGMDALEFKKHRITLIETDEVIVVRSSKPYLVSTKEGRKVLRYEAVPYSAIRKGLDGIPGLVYVSKPYLRLVADQKIKDSKAMEICHVLAHYNML